MEIALIDSVRDARFNTNDSLAAHNFITIVIKLRGELTARTTVRVREDVRRWRTLIRVRDRMHRVIQSYQSHRSIINHQTIFAWRLHSTKFTSINKGGYLF